MFRRIFRRFSGKDLRLASPDGEMEAERQRLRRQLDGLRLVQAEPIREGFYVPEPGDTGPQLYHGAFNLDWLVELGIRPSVIADVGSYDAGDAIRFKLAFRRARVIAFEADADRFSVLSRYADRFGVEACNLAILDQDGPVSWFSAEDDLYGKGHRGSQGSIYRQSEAMDRAFTHVHQSKVPVSVKGARLDTFCMRSGIAAIDLLHMDVQGAEYDVIVGFGHLRPRLIYLETMPEELGGWRGAKPARAIHRLLSSMGYVIAGDFSSDRLYVHYEVIGRPSEPASKSSEESN